MPDTNTSPGVAPWDVAVDPRTRRVYVTLGQSRVVADGGYALHQVGHTVALLARGEQPTTGSLGPEGEVMVLATVQVGQMPRGVAVNPVTGRVYVANAGENTVSVLHEQS